MEVDNDREEERDKEERRDDKQDNGHNAGGVKVKVGRGDGIVNTWLGQDWGQP